MENFSTEFNSKSYDDKKSDFKNSSVKILFDSNPPLTKAIVIGSKPTSISTGTKNITVFKKNGAYFYANERCQHRGMNLKHSKVDSNCLVCPYHGKKNPILGRLENHFNFLWFEKPNYFDVPSDFQFCGSRSITLDAPFPIVLDNFNEGSHTPYVHKFVGPDKNSIHDVNFSWKSFKDFVEINYVSLQRKNFLFYPLLRNYDIQWKIQWKTFCDPVYMRYESTWKNLKTGADIMEKNITYFFLKPNNEKQTEITTFVFIKPLGVHRYFPWLTRKFSYLMTLNQILEDKFFYKKIKDLPLSLEGLNLDIYDGPLDEIRKRVKKTYPNYF
jgi:phenylpropionate dioxygenase-like ring-hydroxylating dioxygenase large terminal subunit